MTRRYGAHCGQVVGEPRVLRRCAAGDVEARVVDGAGQGTAADGLVRGQGDGVDQAELEPAQRVRFGVRVRQGVRNIIGVLSQGLGYSYLIQYHVLVRGQLAGTDSRVSGADMAPR